MAASPRRKSQRSSSLENIKPLKRKDSLENGSEDDYKDKSKDDKHKMKVKNFSKNFEKHDKSDKYESKKTKKRQKSNSPRRKRSHSPKRKSKSLKKFCLSPKRRKSKSPKRPSTSRLSRSRSPEKRKFFSKTKTDSHKNDSSSKSNKSHKERSPQRKYKVKKESRVSPFKEEYGKPSNEEEKKPVKKEKANFETSGKLLEDTNVFKGVVIKYNEPTEARKPGKLWRLYPFKGDQSLPIIHLHRQSAFMIGRDRKISEIPVDHPSCSKQHAVFQFRVVPYSKKNGSKGRQIKPYIIDLESANGTYLNEEKIKPRRYVELMEKDVLKFGFSQRKYVLLHSKTDTSELNEDEVEEEEEEEEEEK